MASLPDALQVRVKALAPVGNVATTEKAALVVGVPAVAALIMVALTSHQEDVLDERLSIHFTCKATQVGDETY